MTEDSVAPGRIAVLLAALAGPQGPWATEEQVEHLRRQLLEGEPAEAAGRLLTTVASRPSLPPSVPVTWPEIDHEAAELLSVLGEYPDARSLLVRSLDDPSVRSVVLEALALLADPAAAPALAELAAAQLRLPFLSEPELVHLASALGCVGGADALAALRGLRSRIWSPEVARELDIALQAIQGPSSG